jgi:threonine synthase
MPRAYLKCTEPACGRKQEENYKRNCCSSCGALLEVNYDFDFSPPEALRSLWLERRSSNELADSSGVWRFRELLPFLNPGQRIVSLSEGSTPLLPAERAGEWAGLARLAVKHQGNNPTGSFKDLGMTACITRAVSQNVRVVACASTGNTSSSMAAYAARAGIKALLFVPCEGISTAKLAQAMDFGALVIESGDSFDQPFQLLNAVAAEMDLYVVNSINPFRIEGQKTIAAELLEQRGWKSPDYIVVPGGNLGNVSAIAKGLRELQALALISRIPKLVVVQAAGANPFYRMLASGAGVLAPVPEPRTEATAIRIGNPANWKKARRALEWAGGFCESVSDDEIRDAKAALAQDGIGCEPASAATVAGLRKLVRAGKIERDAEIVAVLTGHQLKDTDFILAHRAGAGTSHQRVRVEPTLEAARNALKPWLSAAR